MELIERLRDEFGGKFHDLRAAMPESPKSGYDRRQPGQIDMAVVHHSDTSETTTWQVMANYHVQHNTWPGIGYHFGIDPDGTVNYLGDIETRRYHARDANARSIGICCKGDYAKSLPSAAMLLSLGRLIGLLGEHLGVVLSYCGHRDVVRDTECPGDRLYAALSHLQMQPPRPTPAPAEPEQDEDVVSLEKARWWTEEAVRLIEAGNPFRARSVLLPVVAFLYDLERLAHD